MTGKKLGEKFIQITFLSTWNDDDGYDFYVDDKRVFSLEAKGTDRQPRNAYISFCGSPPCRWESLRSCMKKGFAEEYREYFNTTFTTVTADAKRCEFKAFVLLQFEIARRVESEDKDKLFSRVQTVEGIAIALNADSEEGYEKLITMFRGMNKNDKERMLEENEDDLNKLKRLESFIFNRWSHPKRWPKIILFKQRCNRVKSKTFICYISTNTGRKLELDEVLDFDAACAMKYIRRMRQFSKFQSSHQQSLKCCRNTQAWKLKNEAPHKNNLRF